MHSLMNKYTITLKKNKNDFENQKISIFRNILDHVLL